MRDIRTWGLFRRCKCSLNILNSIVTLTLLFYFLVFQNWIFLYYLLSGLLVKVRDVHQQQAGALWFAKDPSLWKMVNFCFYFIIYHFIILTFIYLGTYYYSNDKCVSHPGNSSQLSCNWRVLLHYWGYRKFYWCT